MLERKGEVRTAVINRASAKILQAEIRKHVVPGTSLMTDQLHSYIGMRKDYAHQVINHAEEYVREIGRAHV